MADLAPRARRERWRLAKDRLFGLVMAVGGSGVIVAILLIFFYLAYTVLPLFQGARSAGLKSVSAPFAARLVALDEYAELALSVAADGRYAFVTLADGSVRLEGDLAARAGAPLASLAAGDAASRTLVAGTADGRALFARPEYRVSYPDDRRVVTPALEFPFGDAVEVSAGGDALRLVSGQAGEEEACVAAVTAGGRLLLAHLAREESLLEDEATVTSTVSEIELPGAEITHLAMDVDQRELFVVTADGVLTLFNIQNKTAPRLVDRASAVAAGGRVTAAAFLPGGISLVLGDDRGNLSQWFPVRDAANNYSLARARRFPALPGPVVQVAPEYSRKAFAAIDDGGRAALFHATAAREVLRIDSGVAAARALAVAPRGDALLVAGADGALTPFAVHNEHPEVSFSALWGEVWYESREKPEYIWQSSSASSDFEPKFSLTPLTFGTLKAAFYSMIFAIPLAVLGAVYTAYFMTPPMRAVVKPAIEVMAALPTVILGFLAGLWLAPLVERELLGLGLSLLLVPLATLTAAFGWQHAPRGLRRLLPEGWEALALMPVIAGALWLSLALGGLAEGALFGDSFSRWLTSEYGLAYDQRNSLVVGIAIGFAVIPTIFSISEDAVFSVPRHLTMGSLALGATPWQTALKVVLLTASPGIFSAIMIGMGRAVGETMIVLMATGNTPVMDFNIFQGFRALSANIAVEMPESEVGSTHYRILFLAALVLFLVTFLVNTLAELVRQRLRRKYSSL